MEDLSPQTTARLDALAAEIAQLAERTIESVRADASAAPRDATELQARLRLNSDIRAQAGVAADELERLGRYVSYLREHAQAVAQNTLPLHGANVAPDDPSEKVTPQ